MGMENSGPDLPTDDNGNVLPGSYDNVSWTNGNSSYSIGRLNVGGGNGGTEITEPAGAADFGDSTGNVNFGGNDFNSSPADYTNGYTTEDGGQTRNYGDLVGGNIQIGNGGIWVDGRQVTPDGGQHETSGSNESAVPNLFEGRFEEWPDGIDELRFRPDGNE